MYKIECTLNVQLATQRNFLNGANCTNIGRRKTQNNKMRAVNETTNIGISSCTFKEKI